MRNTARTLESNVSSTIPLTKPVDTIVQKEHVPTPQFNGQITKANRFTSIKNYPYETISKFDSER